jgi:hypothetical protein
MALAAGTIATAIHNLSITGVTVLDITEIPQAVDLRTCPLLCPGPSWISGGIGSSEDGEGPATFGPGMWVFQRVFSYRYFHAKVGTGRGLYDHYSAMSTNLDAIQTAFTTLAVAGVDVMEIDNSEFGIVNDPAENQFYGFDISVALKERINA